MAVARLIEELASEGPVLTDGAWGTELQARGLGSKDVPDSWNLTHPDRVEEVARAYVDAGSQVILTNTFRANRIALAKGPWAEKVAEINRAGVEISRRAAEGRARVFASIGPTGKLLQRRDVTEDEMRAVFDEQARALAEGGADAIVVETMADLTEARLALEAAQATDLPVVACMVFDSGRNKDRTMMGVAPAQAAEELTRCGADAIGANCGTGIRQYVGVCAGLAGATDRPVWIKPNAGLPTFRKGAAVYDVTPEQFADALPDLLEAGAHFVGGCCGTDPAFIATLRARLTTR
jgi:methionine synthase I (cobalamin-dependent)